MKKVSVYKYNYGKKHKQIAMVIRKGHKTTHITIDTYIEPDRNKTIPGGLYV